MNTTERPLAFRPADEGLSQEQREAMTAAQAAAAQQGGKKKIGRPRGSSAAAKRQPSSTPRATEMAAPAAAPAAPPADEAFGASYRPDRHGVMHKTHEMEMQGETIHEADWDRPWSPPSNLEAPPPRPGMTQRWIRVGTADRQDANHQAKQFRNGWRPRRADTVPEGYFPPTLQHGSYSGCIGVEGLILCEMPVARARQMKAHYRHKLERQTEGIEQDLLNVQRPGARGLGPIEKNHQSTVSVGRRPPRVAPDEPAA